MLVHLTGPLSNRQLGSRLEVAARRHGALLSSGQLAHIPPRSPLRLRMGAIETAILEILAGSRAALRPAEIRAMVEQQLDQSISLDTVTSFLSVAAREALSPVIRTSPGHYALNA